LDFSRAALTSKRLIHRQRRKKKKKKRGVWWDFKKRKYRKKIKEALGGWRGPMECRWEEGIKWREPNKREKTREGKERKFIMKRGGIRRENKKKATRLKKKKGGHKEKKGEALELI